MRIDRLKLENFRCFEHMELELHPEMTVLVGGNGAGKTAVVEGLTVAMEAVPRALDFSVAGITRADLRRTRVDREGQIQIEIAQPTTVQAAGSFAGQKCEWARGRKGPTGRTDRGQSTSFVKQIREALLSDVAGSAWPVLAAYGTDRLQGEVGPTRTGTALYARTAAYEDCFRPIDSFTRQMRWIRHQTYADVQVGAPSQHVSAVLSAVMDCLPEVAQLAYSIRAEELLVVFKDGRLVSFDLLSDGYKGILALVADVAWRCVVLNSHLAASAPQLTAGVIVIDEIDLHLHPVWQRRVLADLRRTFPKIQFIVTTHSPQVLASCQPEWVRVVDATGRIQLVDYVHGWDSNSILRDIMGDQERPSFALALVEKVTAAIHAQDWSAADESIAKLEKELGPDDPELTRARLDLSFEREVGGA